MIEKGETPEWFQAILTTICQLNIDDKEKLADIRKTFKIKPELLTEPQQQVKWYHNIEDRRTDTDHQIIESWTDGSLKEGRKMGAAAIRLIDQDGEMVEFVTNHLQEMKIAPKPNYGAPTDP